MCVRDCCAGHRERGTKLDMGRILFALSLILITNEFRGGRRLLCFTFFSSSRFYGGNACYVV